MSRARTAALLAWLMLRAVPALALTLEAPLPDPAQEARAKALFHDIRCMVCQGESIADSPADVAAAQRRDIRERLARGESEADVMAMLAAQYGDGILMRPPLTPGTGLLWFGPLLLLSLSALLAARYFAASREGRP